MNREFGLEWSDFGARFYDGQVARWVQVDPLAEKRIVLSGYNFASLNPILRLDPDGRLDTTYTFNAQGELLSVDHLDDEGVKLLIKSQFGEAETSAFNDPADKERLTRMKEGDLLHIMTGENAGWFLQQSGFDPGKFRPYLPIASDIFFGINSHGKFDYAALFLFMGVGTFHNVSEAESGSYLFLMPDGRIYNMMDTGNWLWGATASTLGFPEMKARLGAHINAIITDREMFDGELVGSLDSDADQTAIMAGHRYSSKNFNAKFYFKNTPRKPFWMGVNSIEQRRCKILDCV